MSTLVGGLEATIFGSSNGVFGWLELECLFINCKAPARGIEIPPIPVLLSK